MKISAVAANPVSIGGDILVLGYSADKKAKNSHFNTINQKFKKHLSTIIKNESYKAATGELKLIATHAYGNFDYVLLVGLGEESKFTTDAVRTAFARLPGIITQIKAKSVVSAIISEEFKSIHASDTVQAAVEGLLLSQYKFSRYLKKPEKDAVSVQFAGLSSQDLARSKKAIDHAVLLSDGVYLARDLVNTPSNHMTPAELAATAKKLKGVSVKIHNLAQIKKMKMGAFLSVAQGSTMNPPFFIEMHYKPKTKAKKKVAIIGKGVTFDTGGYSLKPPKSMETMKDDMAGAAAVIGLMSIITRLDVKHEVSCYVAATENMVSGFAQKPGDICTSMSGKTIEVLNTDAEGRLTLADAMTYALKRKPDYMIDLATLTGACLVALGLEYTGLMGNDQELMDKIIASGQMTGEKLWQLPLAEEYRGELKSPIADLKNIGGSYAGTITAALFLEHFVEKTKWAHLDIAGPSWTDSGKSYIPRGGTGVMVRTLAHFLNHLS